jgi:hypothetical protein
MCYSESPWWVKFQFKIAMLDMNSYSVLLHGGRGAGGGGGEGGGNMIQYMIQITAWGRGEAYDIYID